MHCVGSQLREPSPNIKISGHCWEGSSRGPIPLLLGFRLRRSLSNSCFSVGNETPLFCVVCTGTLSHSSTPFSLFEETGIRTGAGVNSGHGVINLFLHSVAKDLATPCFFVVFCSACEVQTLHQHAATAHVPDGEELHGRPRARPSCYAPRVFELHPDLCVSHRANSARTSVPCLLERGAALSWKHSASITAAGPTFAFLIAISTRGVNVFLSFFSLFV